MTAGRLILLVTSPRVAAGLLTAQAWDALRTNRVLAAAAEHPQSGALAAEGITIEEFGPPEPRALLDVAAGGGVVWLGSPHGTGRSGA